MRDLRLALSTIIVHIWQPIVYHDRLDRLWDERMGAQTRKLVMMVDTVPTRRYRKSTYVAGSQLIGL